MPIPCTSIDTATTPGAWVSVARNCAQIGRRRAGSIVCALLVSVTVAVPVGSTWTASTASRVPCGIAVSTTPVRYAGNGGELGSSERGG